MAIFAVWPGFDWLKVRWGGPNDRRTEVCSYCGATLGEDEVPLILWDRRDNCAEFCERCSARYFEAESFLDPPPEPEDKPDLGTCCICETPGATVLGMLPRRAPMAGRGWGCAVCGLPSDGALAVLCEPCAAVYEAGEATLNFACAGYPATDGRVSIDDLPPGEFKHDLTKHQPGD